jgi:hypothetical protein
VQKLRLVFTFVGNMEKLVSKNLIYLSKFKKKFKSLDKSGTLRELAGGDEKTR